MARPLAERDGGSDRDRRGDQGEARDACDRAARDARGRGAQLQAGHAARARDDGRDDGGWALVKLGTNMAKSYIEKNAQTFTIG